MRLLFIGAHTDDELSSAGTLAKYIEKGHEVSLAVFSFCEESSKALGYDSDILKREFHYAMMTLGIDKNNVFVHHYPVRHFPEHRQAILENLVLLNATIKPNLVLVPYEDDVHQDHHVIAEESKRAFGQSGILGYEISKVLVSTHILFVRLQRRHLAKKMECLRCYESQSKRAGASSFIKTALAMVRGSQAGCMYAEAFEVVRLFL